MVATDPTASEVYDRQIRLWGLEAQKRMQESKVLFIGMRSLQTEVGRQVDRGIIEGLGQCHHYHHHT